MTGGVSFNWKSVSEVEGHPVPGTKRHVVEVRWPGGTFDVDVKSNAAGTFPDIKTLRERLPAGVRANVTQRLKLLVAAIESEGTE